jgi:hypothetical protein
MKIVILDVEPSHAKARRSHLLEPYLAVSSKTENSLYTRSKTRALRLAALATCRPFATQPILPNP